MTGSIGKQVPPSHDLRDRGEGEFHRGYVQRSGMMESEPSGGWKGPDHLSLLLPLSPLYALRRGVAGGEEPETFAPIRPSHRHGFGT